MIFKLENNLKMAILHSHKRKAPCIYIIGPESSSQIPEKNWVGENRSLDKKRPRYILLTTNVAQPKKKDNYKNSSKFRFIVLLSSWKATNGKHFCRDKMFIPISGSWALQHTLPSHPFCVKFGMSAVYILECSGPRGA